VPPCSECEATQSIILEDSVHNISFYARSKIFINIYERQILIIRNFKLK
jgi:hypothetical protein